MSERPPISPRSPRAALEPEQVPPPPKRSDRARNPFVIVGNAIITLLLIAMIGAGGVYYYGRQVLEAPGPLKEDKIVNIPQRAGKRDIAETLNREGVTDVNPWAFIASVAALKASSDLKPGEYSFQKNASLRDVIATIVEGKVVQHAVTIPEGLTSEQIVARLSDNDIFTGSVRELPREGTLLPETYKFPRGTPRDQVIQRMQQAHKRVLTEIWERRNQDIPVKSPEQLVTLASIVEKETGKPDERSRVAAVFVNRLKQRIKLQVRSHDHLWPRRRQGHARPSDQAQRDHAAFALQHLSHRGPAAGPDLQPRPRLARGCRQPGPYPRPLFRRGWYRRAFLYRDLRRAPEERRQAARHGKADPERHGRAGRGRAAAGRRRARRRRYADGDDAGTPQPAEEAAGRSPRGSAAGPTRRGAGLAPGGAALGLRVDLPRGTLRITFSCKIVLRFAWLDGRANPVLLEKLT
ncbi:hypothetical protein ACVWZV_006580 [Bradyrhizobium sp. GM5.1]